MFEFRVLTSREQELIHRNCQVYDMLFEAVGNEKRCANESCTFPLSAMDKGFFLLGIGNVCDMCHTMYAALVGPRLKDQKYFRTLHEDWVRDHTLDRNRLGLK